MSFDTGCPCEFRAPNSENVTAVEPAFTAWNVKTAIPPDPLTPDEPGSRFRFTVASPLSFRIFRVKMILCPSLDIRLPAWIA